MKRLALLLVLGACSHGPVVRSLEQVEMADEQADAFAQKVKILKVLAYADKARNKPAQARRGADIVRDILREKGYEVEFVSQFRTSARRLPAQGGYRTTYHLDNDSMLRPHEGYLEVYVGEELWEGGKPFTDYSEVGRVEESEYGRRMEMVKVPNLAGHNDVRRSVETEVFLFARGRADCLYNRSAFVKERAFNHRKALSMALSGIPKRK